VDRYFREAEVNYLQDPSNSAALLRYWVVGLRIGRPIELTILRPEHSCDPDVEIFILENNDAVTIHGVPLAVVREHIHQEIYGKELDDYPLLREAEIYTTYLGWMPDLFDLTNSQNKSIRDQVVAPGLFALSYMGPHRHYVTRKAYYFSLYLEQRPYSNLPFTADIESIEENGEGELGFIFGNSCRGPLVQPLANTLPQAKLARRRPLVRTDIYPRTLNEVLQEAFGELEQDEPSSIYIPIFDIDATSFLNRHNIWNRDDEDGETYDPEDDEAHRVARFMRGEFT
jgi:hypothetical protein